MSPPLHDINCIYKPSTQVFQVKMPKNIQTISAVAKKEVRCRKKRIRRSKIAIYIVTQLLTQANFLSYIILEFFKI